MKQLFVSFEDNEYLSVDIEKDKKKRKNCDDDGYDYNDSNLIIVHEGQTYLFQ